MSQTYYLWNSYKGIVNKFNNATGQYGNTVEKWINLLRRGEGDGNQNYYAGKIGNVSYTNLQVFDEDFYHENSGIPEGRFVVSIPSASDSSTQNLTGSARTNRLSLGSFNDKEGLTEVEKANFYGEFGISRGFNRAYKIKTSVEVDSLSQGAGRTELAKQAKVSLNNDGNYVDVNDGEFLIRFSNHDENPFEGIGCLFSFMTWPFKEPIYYPYRPDKTSTVFVLICDFDEDVTDLEISHFVVTNCSISEVRKITAKKYWVFFQISEPEVGEITTNYSIQLQKDKVTAVNDSNKKNRTQSINYSCIQNNGRIIAYTTSNSSHGNRRSRDFGETFTKESFTIHYSAEFVGYKFIGASGDNVYESFDGFNWELLKGGSYVFNSTNWINAAANRYMVEIVSGKDGSGNNLLIGITEIYDILYSRDGGYNWFRYDGLNKYRERQYGYNITTVDPNMTVYGLTYANGIWLICGADSKLKYSTDGYSFINTNVSIDNTDFRDVGYHDGNYLVVGKTGSNGCSGYSTDGINWTIDTETFPNVHGSRYYGGTYLGPIQLISDNSGTVVCMIEHANGHPMWYSHDAGVTWNSGTGIANGKIYGSESHYKYDNRVLWNGHLFYHAGAQSGQGHNSYSYDGITWENFNTGSSGGGNGGYTRRLLTNYYNSGESIYSDVDGILNVTVAEVMEISDISLNYFPSELVPQAWWENMLTNPANIEERKKENDTRRNYLFSKIFEANETLTYFDISSNVINMPPNTIKETIRVYKKDANNSFEINLSTNTDINKDRGYYVQLENIGDKVNYTNAANDISFNLVKTGVDSNGYATYEIEKTGGTNNFVVDF